MIKNAAGSLRCEVERLGQRGVALVHLAVDLVPELEAFDAQGNRLTAALSYYEDGTASLLVTRHTGEPSLLVLAEAWAMNQQRDETGVV